jgi:hypothetical protein
MSEIPGQSGHALPTLRQPVCATNGLTEADEMKSRKKAIVDYKKAIGHPKGIAELSDILLGSALWLISAWSAFRTIACRDTIG